MKKLYFCLLAVIVAAISTSAQVNYTFDLTVDKPSELTVQLLNGSEVVNAFDVVEGANHYEFEVPNGEYYYFNVKVTEGYKLIMLEDGTKLPSELTNNEFKKSLSGYSWATWSGTSFAYTVRVFSAEDYKNRTVKLTFDEPQGVQFTLRGNSAVKADQKEYEIAYNDEFEDRLEIRPTNTDEILYKVTADGKDVVKDGLTYTIPLVDRSDADDIQYVKEIAVLRNFPEGFTYNVKIAFANENPACVSSVTYGGEAITDFDAADGFDVVPGKKLVITLNKDDFGFDKYVLNGSTTYISYASSIEKTVDCDLDYVITATEYKYFDASIVTTDPASVKVTRYSYPYSEIKLEGTETKFTFKNDGSDDKINVEAADGYELVKIYDQTYDQTTTVSTYNKSTIVYLKENSKIELVAEKIVRDQNLVFYFDDLSDFYFGAKIKRGGVDIPAQLGYNLVDYRTKDGLITIDSYGAQDLKAYRNYEEVSFTYYSSLSISNPVDGEVIKLFFKPANAVEHTVTFAVTDGALDGYEVKKDILSAVDTSAPVSAIGKTQFTIAPASRAAGDLNVKVGDTAVTPVDGVYTFETEADTTVTVGLPSSGIEDVVTSSDKTVDVYNLQGIRVAHSVNAADVDNLPAGIYIVNGKKVAVK